MIPILYDTITEGVTPSHYGIGALTDCLECSVTEERNGAYELTLVYNSNGVHADEIKPNAIIKAKPNYTDAPQLFRVYKVGKDIGGKFTVNAQHISYDLGGKVFYNGEEERFILCQQACNLLGNHAGAFTITTDISASAWFGTPEPASVRSWFGGRAGSLIDLYGGEWHYDNFTCSLMQARGQDRGVNIRYGKNLTALSQEVAIDQLATGILPYAYNNELGYYVTTDVIDTGLTLDTRHDVAIDFTEEINWDDISVPYTTQLENACRSYIARNLATLTQADNSITLDFVQMSTLNDRVDLCDTVHIYYEPLGIAVTSKCVKYTWDVLKDRYTSTTFGSVRGNIAQTITQVKADVKNAPSFTEVTTIAQQASALITGNMGGYVVLHDGDGDGEPDELLIMDTPDINTATKVWRFNNSGLGYSSTGYAGYYGTAMTSNGEIVADFIKAGVISDALGRSEIDMLTGEARMFRLKAVSSFDLIDEDESVYAQMRHNNTHESVLSLKNYAILTGATEGSILELKKSSPTPNANRVTLASWSDVQDEHGQTIQDTSLLSMHNTDGVQTVVLLSEVNQRGAYFELSRKTGAYGITFDAQEAAGGSHIHLYTKNEERGIELHNSDNGGAVMVNDVDGNLRGAIAMATDGKMYLKLYDNTDTLTIQGEANTGALWCTTLHQTSSRKIKKNIEPMQDARKILELDAVSFDYKNEERGTDKRGFIAEDVAKVLPNLVTPETDDRPASLDYVGMIPYLQKIIKEQDERIKALEEKIKTIGG